MDINNTYFDLGKLQLIKDSSEVVDLLVKLVPYLALRVFQIHRQFVLDPDDLLTAHTLGNEGHNHDDIA